MEYFLSDIPEKTFQEWQSIVDLLARIAGVRVSLIMRLVGDEIEVFVASHTPGNPYHPGDRDHFHDSGLYCEAVITAQEKLHVLDARLSEVFNKNPDLKYGMSCYLGFPICLPDGKPFGTICLLDDKAHSFPPDLLELMEKMRDLIESQLALIDENRLQRLFASESALRQILDNSPTAMGCATLEAKARIIYLNHQFVNLFGYTLTDLPTVETWFARAFPAEPYCTANQHVWQAAVEQARLPDGKAGPGEFRVICKDGRMMDVLLSARVVDEMLLFSLIDITERKRAEMELRRSEERIRLLTENISDVIWVLNLNQKCFTYISPSIQQLRGYTVEEAMLQTLEESLTPESIQLVMKELTTNVPLFIAHPERLQNFITEVQQPCKDGTLIWVEVTTKFRFNAAQEIEVVGVSRNIERRKRAETELRVSEERHRLLADNSIDIILTMSTDGKVTYISPSVQHLSGFTPEEFMQMHWEDFLSPDLLRIARDSLARACAGAQTGRPVYFLEEMQLRCKDGSTIWVEFTGSGIYAADGRLVEIFGIGRDVSERKRYVQKLQQAHEAIRAANIELEQRVQERTIELRKSRDALSVANIALEKALRTRDEFMAAVSHELRTPLTTILGLVEMLQLPYYGSLSEKQHKAVVNIENSGRRLLDLVNEVLDYTQIQSGKANQHIEACSLAGICNRSLQAIGSKAAAKAQHLNFYMTPPDMQVEVDERHLLQILVNLLENAVKFTPQQGRIDLTVTGKAETGEVQMSVSDTGIGIREEDFPKLFQPFVQLDARLARGYEGTGLGLALVKALVELYGGSVTVTSTFGKGSTFTVTLRWQK